MIQVGYIYKIFNDINDNVYIGQTIQPINIRFWQHKNDAKKGSVSSIHLAIIKYGEEHFFIEKIEECEISESALLQKAHSVGDIVAYCLGSVRVGAYCDYFAAHLAVTADIFNRRHRAVKSLTVTRGIYFKSDTLFDECAQNCLNKSPKAV